MASSAAATPIQAIKDYASQHNNEHILIRFAPDAKGVRAPELAGFLRNGLIKPADGSAYTGSQVFPQAGAHYEHITTSADGQNVSSAFSPNGQPTPDEALRMLHDLQNAAQDRASHERQLLLAEAQKAEEERLFLLRRSDTATAQRDELAKEADRAADARQLLSQQVDAAAQNAKQASAQRDALLATADQARAERQMLLQALQDSQATMATMAQRLSQLESHQVSPSPTQPTSVGPDMSSFLQQLAAAVASMNNHSVRTTPSDDSQVGTIASYLRPYVTSHGPSACPLLSPNVVLTLSSDNFEMYRWRSSNTSLAARIRLALTEMASLMTTDKFASWAENNGVTLTPTEWVLFTTSTRQAALELAACIKIGDRPLHSILIFSRIPTADASLVTEYASGSLRVPGIPLLGSHNGATNRNHNTSRATGANNNDRGSRGGRGGAANGGRGGGSESRRVHGGGDNDHLAALNALVRI